MIAYSKRRGCRSRACLGPKPSSTNRWRDRRRSRWVAGAISGETTGLCFRDRSGEPLEPDVGAYEDVNDTWRCLSRDGHVGMSDAFQIVAAAANSDPGRRALTEILARVEDTVIVDPDALSYLRVSRDVP